MFMSFEIRNNYMCLYFMRQGQVHKTRDTQCTNKNGMFTYAQNTGFCVLSSTRKLEDTYT